MTSSQLPCQCCGLPHLRILESRSLLRTLRSGAGGRRLCSISRRRTALLLPTLGRNVSDSTRGAVYRLTRFGSIHLNGLGVFVESGGTLKISWLVGDGLESYAGSFSEGGVVMTKDCGEEEDEASVFLDCCLSKEAN
jgi:hypothetical protein